MTDEKLEETNTQISEKKELQTVLERHVKPISGIKAPVKRKKRNIFGSVWSFLLGFLLGGTKFPLNRRALPTRYISSLLMFTMLRRLSKRSAPTEFCLPLEARQHLTAVQSYTGKVFSKNMALRCLAHRWRLLCTPRIVTSLSRNSTKFL